MYEINAMSDDLDDVSRVVLAAHGINFGNAIGCGLLDVQRVYFPREAYLLCFSEHFNPDVPLEDNEYRIKIREPYNVFRLLSNAIKAQLFPDQELGKAFKKICYGSRVSDYRVPISIDQDFLKTPDYSHEFEVRMLWRPAFTTIQSRFDHKIITCPEIEPYCELL
jgi:hypothetical protein